MNNSGGAELPLLSGSTPGLVDTSQRTRLLRTPGSSLFFAAFDPHTARATDSFNLSSLHIDPGTTSKRVDREASAGSNGKRIVIETDPETGTCSWRFVPRARVEGVFSGDEGPWPRIVELCGQLVHMNQDQWDLHKLDPEYDCLVRTPPNITVITRKTPNIPESDANSPPFTPKAASKAVDDNTPMPKPKHLSPQKSDLDSPRKRRIKPLRVNPKTALESDKMAVDEDVFHVLPMSTHKTNAHDVGNGKKRRRESARLGETSTSEAEKSKGKAPRRRESSVFADISTNPHSKNAWANNNLDGDVFPMPAKKVRTRSPTNVRREMEQKRLERDRKRKADMEARLKLRRDLLSRAFWDRLGVPNPMDDPSLHIDPNGSDDSEDSDGDTEDGFTTPSDSAMEGETEAERLAKIEESRRKLADLEKDKPLWEESARKRQARELEEEHLRQRAKVMKEEEERRRQQAQAARRHHEEKWEQDRLGRERQVRMRQKSARMFVLAPRGIYRWSTRHALDRYIEAAANFDVTRFSATRPLAFASIPWPILDADYTVDAIEWDAVETFFEKVQVLMPPTEFKEFVEKSHRRFHPDRWRSRGLLVSMKDDMERDLLEVAGSTVAQALTPLWKQVTGR